MPERNGLEICKILKSKTATRDIPIIILTSNEGKRYLLEGIQAGADEFANKELDHEILITKINAVIRFRDVLLRNVELELFRSIQALITTLNHEINNPLSVAIGMLGSGPENFTQSKYDNIKSSLSRISCVVKEMKKVTIDDINFSKYSRNKEMLNLRKANY